MRGSERLEPLHASPHTKAGKAPKRTACLLRRTRPAARPPPLHPAMLPPRLADARPALAACVLRDGGNQAKRVKGTIGRGRPVVGYDQPLGVWDTRLLKRPTHAEVPCEALCEGRQRAESGHLDHRGLL